MPDTSVVYFDSTMTGAPALSGTAGALIGILDACLQDGFGGVTLGSLVVTDNVATATYSNGHGFAMQGNTGPVILIAGATPSGLNGRWRVTVTSTTQFTFATSGISNQTATGTITAKRAPAGFSKTYSGTNKAAYRADAIAGTRLYLRVDDTGTTNARVRGYETMSDVDTGTGLFPTDAQLSGGGYVYKSSAASSATRSWSLVSDGRMLYFRCDPAANASWAGGLAFGDVHSFVAGDAYSALLMGSTISSWTFPLSTLNSASGYLPRTALQIGSSVLTIRYSHSVSSTMGGSLQPYPSPAGGLLHLWPVEVWESAAGYARGILPGVWNPLHPAAIVAGIIVDDVPQQPGHTFIGVNWGGDSAAVVLDITGPWR